MALRIISETCGLCGLEHETERCIYWPTTRAKDARIAELEAQLADANARINEQDRLLREWQEGSHA
jgi:hypothetical protein